MRGTEKAQHEEKHLNSLHIPVESTALPNGLRVVISPDRAAPVATVGVYYNIGFRLEPRGRSGFAHLFEHMMFQGSENAGKMVHIKLINSSGGVLNGSTHYDVTNYYESVPSNALERVLWLEADRMRALKVDDENLRNQRDVVKEEVRVNVLNQPYGGFPWLDLPPMAFRNWPNAHNFYGDFDDLDAATLGDVQKFFHTYYAPSNAVLLILGDVDPEARLQARASAISDHPAGPAASAADVSEPPSDGRAPRRSRRKIRHAARHRHRIPRAASPHARLVRRWPCSIRRCMAAAPAASIAGWCSSSKLPWTPRAAFIIPSAIFLTTTVRRCMVTRILHKPEYSVEQTIAAYDAVLDEVREKGIEREELEQVKVKFRSDYFSSLEGGHGHPALRLDALHGMFHAFRQRSAPREFDSRRIHGSHARSKCAPSRRNIWIPARAPSSFAAR